MRRYRAFEERHTFASFFPFYKLLYRVFLSIQHIYKTSKNDAKVCREGHLRR